jgi:hypothetical protein
MESDANRVIAQILRADDPFVTEVGRLTLIFSCIEDSLSHDALELAQIVDDKHKEIWRAKVSKMPQFRILDKRDVLRHLYKYVGHFYGVDYSRVNEILGELGNINRLRRVVVHGWIRWSVANEEPIFVDSHGESVPASPTDVAGLNLRALNWVCEYHLEQAGLMRAALRAYDALADRLLRRPRLSCDTKALFRKLKTKASDSATE